MLVFDDKNINEAIVCLNKTKMSVFADKKYITVYPPKISSETATVISSSSRYQWSKKYNI